MAKKKKHRNPIAPPIHSAPDKLHQPTYAQQPTAAVPASAPTRSESPPPRLRDTVKQRQAARKRRSRQRTYLIIGSAVVLIVALIVGRNFLSGRSIREFNTLANANGCADLNVTSGSGEQDHLQPGEQTTYEESPPTHGKHAASTLPAGAYDEELPKDATEDINIFKAVHSLEHGAIIIWHDRLSEDALDRLEARYGAQPKVLVVPYKALEGKSKVAMSAWGRSVTCTKVSNNVIDEFIDRFRSARTAPEPNSTI